MWYLRDKNMQYGQVGSVPLGSRHDGIREVSSKRPRSKIHSLIRNMTFMRCGSHFTLRCVQWVSQFAMSGLEIAGVVLATVPIVVAALQQYKGKYDPTHKKWDQFRHKAQYVNKLIDSLEWQETLIKADVITLVVSATTLTYEDLELIECSNYGHVLAREDIRLYLRKYLGKRYDRFHKALNKCDNTLKDIAANISGYTSGSLVWHM